MDWTNKQLEVINCRERNILVSAAAGSGKTAVLVERIIKMITDEKEPVDIDRLLVVTFTRAAASEMRERIRESLEKMSEANPEDINLQKQLSFIHNAKITTIDSFCASVVKENFDKIDLDPNFRIADETEIEMLKSDIIEGMLEEYYEVSDSDFINLAEQYSAGKLSDNIGNLIDILYRHASGFYNPEQWVLKSIESYNVESIEELEQSDLVQGILEMMRKQLDCQIKRLETACSISDSENGPKVSERLNELITMIETARNSRTYDGMRKALSEVKSVTIRAVKDCDELKKKQVSAIKTDVSKSIKEMHEKIFDQDIKSLFEDMKNSRASVEMIVRLTLDFMKRFKEEKTEKGIIDFTDQAHYAMEILNDEDEHGKLVPSETARQIATRYKEIMIDEYQDSNYIQEAILTSVSNGYGTNNMFMVGDVKQSIYRFRQAEPKLFLGKYDTYSEDEKADCRKIILDDNFRSRKEVIESVNFIFDYIMHRELGGIDYKNSNRLLLGAKYDEPPENQNNDTEFILIEGDDKKTEAEYVAQKIREITDSVTGMKITENGKNMRPVRYGDIAILLRSMKGNSEIYHEQLENNGIPAYAETKTGYYQALEVKTIINMLSIIDNPRQDIPLAAVMVSPMFSFTSNELAQIKAENLKDSFFESIESYSENGSDTLLSNKAADFLEQLNKFRNMVPYTSVYEMINEILKDTGYDYYIRSMPNGKRRYFNIEALKEKAVAYDATSYKGLFNFIRYIEKLQYLAKDDGEASIVSESDNLVHIMSIHKSKGLQFPVVFVCNTAGASKNDIDKIVADEYGNIGVDYIDNQLKIKAPTIVKKAIKLKNKEEDKAEQLRILYVALTRAKEKLFITGLSKDLEKTLGQFMESRYDDNDVLSYGEILGAKNFMEWIGKSIARNKAFDVVMDNGDDFEFNKKIYNADSYIDVKTVRQDEIEFTGAVNEIYDEIKRETLHALANPQRVDKAMQREINEKFDFEYPFAEDITLHSKASVTDIKKQNMEYEEEQDGAEMYPQTSVKHHTELPEIIPEFAKEKQSEEILFGAQRGTAYHRVFELLDMGLDDYNEVNVQNMIEGFVSGGLLGRDEADSINVSDIVTFTKSKLFDRMRIADKNGELFRERKFLMGVPAKDINRESDSEETMIIQGIIDVCFIEAGKYVIADYKTDRVSEMSELKDRYHIQLECYKRAIEQISEIEVSEMIIYSVTLGDEMSL